MNSPESNHVLHTPQIVEQPVTPEREPELHLRESVLRPDDIVKKGIRDRARALAMAGVLGLSGAMTTDDAKAGVFADQLGAVVTVGLINGIANGIRQAQSVPTFAPGAMEQLAAMGITYDPSTRILTNNMNVHDEPIFFGPKTMSVRISPVAGGVVISAMVNNGAGGAYLERLLVTSEIIKVEGQPDKRILRKSRI